MKMTSPELQKLIEAVHGCIIERPTDLVRLNLSMENLIGFLTMPVGHTNQNCKETDLYFCLHDNNGFNCDHLPEDYQLILDDIGGQLHDTIESPEVAKNFESTPEQLLERIRKIKNV